MAKGACRRVSRSAISGKFVKDSYRKQHPNTTIGQNIKMPSKKK